MTTTHPNTCHHCSEVAESMEDLWVNHARCSDCEQAGCDACRTWARVCAGYGFNDVHPDLRCSECGTPQAATFWAVATAGDYVDARA